MSHSTLEERLRHYADQEQTHHNRVLADADDLREAADEIEDAEYLSSALLDLGWTFARINEAATAVRYGRGDNRRDNSRDGCGCTREGWVVDERGPGWEVIHEPNCPAAGAESLSSRVGEISLAYKAWRTHSSHPVLGHWIEELLGIARALAFPENVPFSASSSSPASVTEQGETE